MLPRLYRRAKDDDYVKTMFSSTGEVRSLSATFITYFVRSVVMDTEHVEIDTE